jgi:hypothetical protein
MSPLYSKDAIADFNDEHQLCCFGDWRFAQKPECWYLVCSARRSLMKAFQDTVARFGEIAKEILKSTRYG